MKTIVIEEQCSECGGSGVYKGFAEKGGLAVVCIHCNGTGKYTFKHSYKEFVGIQKRNSIKWVIPINPGYSLSENSPDIGGMSYDEWQSGKKFTGKFEDRKRTCPRQYYQRYDYNKIPEWDDCQSANAFKDCKNYQCKEKCWRKWDNEQKT
jgi:hypothetical protein